MKSLIQFEGPHVFTLEREVPTRLKVGPQEIVSVKRVNDMYCGVYRDRDHHLYFYRVDRVAKYDSWNVVNLPTVLCNDSYIAIDTANKLLHVISQSGGD